LGTFDNVSTGANLPFGRLTAIYAENGRGKTTLSAVFRSLATGDVIHVVERHRLGAQHAAQVRIDADGGNAVFENNAWDRTLPDLVVFDDAFVDQNIHSGLAVDPDHRQNLHELILGTQGVTLSRRHLDLMAQNEALNGERRIREQAIPAAIRGTYTVDQFCELQAEPRIEAMIQEATRTLEAARQQEPIRQQPLFQPLSLPAFDVAGIERLLAQNLPALDAQAAARVQAHIARIGAGGENWVAEGMGRVPPAGQGEEQPCPFCAQSLADSPVIAHYRAYFSEGYTNLKRAVDTMRQAVTRAHDGDAQVAFVRSIGTASATWGFWSRYADVHAVILEQNGDQTDLADVTRDWGIARGHVLAALQAKQAAPLESAVLSDDAKAAIATYNGHRALVEKLNGELQASNALIREAKANAAAGNVAELTRELTRLQAVRARQEQANRDLCDAYKRATDAKARNDQDRDAARAALEQHRAAAFPAIQAAVNVYLERFGAGFRLANVEPVNSRAGSACNYSVVINNVPVSIAGGQPAPGQPSFRNTLSAGDRNTLTLAFFFASLDRDPTLAQKMVVIDDPFSSHDAHRAIATIQEIRNLAGRVAQVVVLSHNKGFLTSLWAHTDRNRRASLQVVRDGVGSALAQWDVRADEYNEHDRRHERMRAYAGNPAEAHAVAQDIRPTVEAYLRVAYPEHFPPGSLIGPFIGLCEQRIAAGNALLSQGDTDELRALNAYGSQFHHDTNAAYNPNAQISDAELTTHVGRTFRFTRRA
jgi:wobble nucleotide-excising tRNase